MAPAGMLYKELRFLIGENLTECYVLIEALGDCPLGVQGWHHKTFDKFTNVVQIIEGFAKKDPGGDPVLWPLDAPMER